MGEHFFAQLVLTRGPVTLQRRISLRIPLDNSRVTVGRGLENDVVLDAGLLFASQRHCDFFVRCTNGIDKASEAHTSDAGEKVENLGKEHAAAALELCIVDVGSTNGTFVNGVRAVVDVATPLHNCDEIVFGGMRDVAAGEPIPEDALTNAPEIVTWRVVFDNDQDDVDFGYVATPQVVLRAEYLEMEEKRMALQLLQDLTATQATTTTTTTAAMTPSPKSCGSASALTPPPTVLKRVPLRRSGRGEEEEETKNSPQALMARRRRPRGDGASTRSSQRSGMVAAKLLPRTKCSGAAALATVAFRAFSAGAYSFSAPRAAAAVNGQRRGLRGASDCQQVPHTLVITETQWKWTVEEKAFRKRRRLVECALPWYFVERVVYCTPQRGLTALLLPDCPHFLPFAGEARFVTWLVAEETEEGKENTTTATLTSFQQLLDYLCKFCAVTKGCSQPQPIDTVEFFANYAPGLQREE